MFGKEPEEDFTRELDEAVQAARKNKKWRVLSRHPVYVCLAQPEWSGEGLYDTTDALSEKYEQGVEQEKEKMVRRLIGLGKFLFEEIATITELSVEKVKEIANMQLI